MFRAFAFLFKAYRTWVAGVAGYLIGSWMVRHSARRASASGNGAGPDGVGRPLSAAFVAGEVVKGAAGARAGHIIGGDAGGYAAAIGVVAGQCFPAFADFRGGKSIGTAAGTALVCFPAGLPVVGGLAALAWAKLRRPDTVVAVAGGAFALASALWWLAGLPAGRGRKASGGLAVYALVSSALVAWQWLAKGRGNTGGVEG